MFESPPNPNVDILALEDAGVRRWCPEVGAHVNGMSVLTKRPHSGPLPLAPCEDPVGRLGCEVGRGSSPQLTRLVIEFELGLRKCEKNFWYLQAPQSVVL